MNLGDSPEERDFRLRLRAWLAENAPADPLPVGLLASVADDRLREWHRRLYAGGWLGLSWPAEFGGQGLGPVEEAIFNEELAAANLPTAQPPAFIARAIMNFGTTAQQEKYLAPMLRGDEFWAQGFSEPEAGSDLAGLRTRGVLDPEDGRTYRITGQKIWTTGAQFADRCFVLCRTEPDAPKHKGITAIIVDLDAPGVTVRPIVTLSGHNEFAEVFFDETPVPAENVVGEPGAGWRVALTTLTYERGPMDIAMPARYGRILNRLAEQVRQSGAADDGHIRHRLGQAEAAVEVLRLHCLRSLTDRAKGVEPGPEGSIDKLLMARTEQLLLEVAGEIVGAPAVVEPYGEDGFWFNAYLYSRAATIYGGTAQVQRSILANRVLGLR